MSAEVATTAGVLLAAGRGRRMGRLKQLLPWGASTVVAASFDALAASCGAGMVLVAGADADDIERALEGRAYELIRADSDAEQIASTRAGLGAALQRGAVSHVFLHPADHPVIPADVLEALRGRAGARQALIPTHQGRGGHPVLIPAAIAASIAAQQPGRDTGGLRAYWQAQPHLVERVEFPAAPVIVMDLDTPGDYERAAPPPR